MSAETEPAAGVAAPIPDAEEGGARASESVPPTDQDAGSSEKSEPSPKGPIPAAKADAEGSGTEDAAVDETKMELSSGGEKPGGVKTTINSKFRASPILKNPKDEAPASGEQSDAQPAAESRASEPAARDEPKKTLEDRDRESQAGEANQEPKEGEPEDGPNVISPNRPMMPYRHGVAPRDPYAHARPAYYSPYGYGYPPSPSRAMPGPSAMYQYSPVRTKSPEWRNRRMEYPSPPHSAAKEPLTPRGEGGHHPFSPGYLSSPFAGWHSPYPRHGWESPDGKAPAFRDKPGDDKRPSPYPRPPQAWNSFGEPFGGSFDEMEPPAGAAKPPFARTPPRGGPKPPPPHMPDDPYWAEYGPYDHYHGMYSPQGPPPPSWSLSPARMPPPPPGATPGKKGSRSKSSAPASASSSRRPPSAGATAVTPTSSQEKALEQFGAAVEYCKGRLQELLQLSSPAKSGGASDIPPAVTLEPAPDTLFGDITNHDVLLGRGGGTNTQAGNKRFRTIVNAHQPMYLEAKRKEKPLIARCIVEWIRQEGGRFLTKEEDSGKWYEVGDHRAEAKTSQALREGLEVRATKNNASSGGSVGSNGGAKKRSKKGRSDPPPPPKSSASYDQDHWEGPHPGYMPPSQHPSQFYARPPNFYEHSRRIRGRQPEDPYAAMPPYPHYGHMPPYHPADYGNPPKRPRWGPPPPHEPVNVYPSVPNVLSEEDRQYYKDFSPPATKSCKVPVVAPSYDAGDPPETQ